MQLKFMYFSDVHMWLIKNKEKKTLLKALINVKKVNKKNLADFNTTKNVIKQYIN